MKKLRIEEALREIIRLNRLKTDMDMYLYAMAKWGLDEWGEKPNPEDFGIEVADKSDLTEPKKTTKEIIMTPAEQAIAGIPNLVKDSIFFVIVCVPKKYSEKQVLDEAEKLAPSGMASGWKYYEEGHSRLRGAQQNVTCLANEDMTHVFLVA